MKRSTLNHLTLSALIAALYAAFTTLSASMGLAIGIFEFRLSEAQVHQIMLSVFVVHKRLPGNRHTRLTK